MSKIFTKKIERFQIKIFPFLQKFFKKNTYILIDDLFEEDAECIDTYSLFCYMQKHNIPSYYVVWKKNYFYTKLKKENKLKNVIVVKERFGTDFIRKSFWILLKTKIIISGFLNWGNFTPERKLVQDFVNNTKSFTHVYLNHGVTFFKKDVLKAYSPQNFKKLIVSNNLEKKIYIEKAAWQEKNIIKGGLARWDLLKKEVHKEKNIFVFFTFRKTFGQHRNYKEFDYYKKIISLFQNKKLQQLLVDNNVKLIYGMHHALKNQTNLDWNISNPNIIIADTHHISHYIAKTDLFITDYSSIAFDFMFLNIPVIFYKLDFKDTRLSDQDRCSMDSFCECEPYIYNIIEEEDRLIEKIQQYINTKFSQVNEHKQKNKLFFYYSSNIAKHIVKELEKI